MSQQNIKKLKVDLIKNKKKKIWPKKKNCYHIKFIIKN